MRISPIIQANALGAMRALEQVDGPVAEGLVPLWQDQVEVYDTTLHPLPGGGCLELNPHGLARLRDAEGHPGKAWEMPGSSTPVLSTPRPGGGVVFSDGETVHSYGPDGIEMWHCPLGERIELRVSPSADGSVVLFGTSGLLRVGADGKRSWSRPDSPPRWGMTATVGPDARIYVPCRGGIVRCLDPEGGQVWQAALPQGTEAATSIVVAGGNVFLAGDDGRLYAIRDGQVRWSSEPLGGDPSRYKPPVCDRENVYFVAGPLEETTFAFRSDGSPVWQKNDLGPVAHLTSLPGGGVAVGSHWGKLHAFAPGGGNLWTYGDGFPLDPPHFDAEGFVYVTSRKEIARMAPADLHRELQVEAAVQRALEPAEAPGSIERQGPWLRVGSVRLPVRE